MISAILLNWQRTDNVHTICAQLAKEPLVGEIIVWNNNPQVRVEPPAEKARVVNCSEDFGLFTRFAAASLARHECVLYHDDDLLAAEGTLAQLYERWRAAPLSCHTLFGRNAGPAGEYNGHIVFGPVEIVLTRYTMAHRRVCVHALSKVPQLADLPGVPVGNGEDIVLSYAAMDLSRRLNHAYNLPSTELGQDENVSIHKRFPEHAAHRTRVIARCRKVFRVHTVLWQNRIYRGWLRAKKAVRRRLPATAGVGG